MTAMEDLYRLLQCESNASAQELKKAYQKLALKCHPDKRKGCASDDEFVKINRAWGILSDPVLREQFDARWKERCLAQTYPIQDTVHLKEFEEVVDETEDHSSEIDGLDTDSEANEPAITKTKDQENGENYNVGQTRGTDDNSGGVKVNESCSIPQNSYVKNDDYRKAMPEERRGNAELYCVEKSGSSKEEEYKTKQLDDTDATCEIDRTETRVYSYSCRCGGSYVLTTVDIKLKFDIVCCDTCSLSVQVIYPDAEEG